VLLWSEIANNARCALLLLVARCALPDTDTRQDVGDVRPRPAPGIWHISYIRTPRPRGSDVNPITQNEPIAHSGAETRKNALRLRQPLRPVLKRAGGRPRGPHVARGGTRNFRNEVGSPTRRHPTHRPVLGSGSGEASGWFLAKDLRS
jgi:hypothetical protein